MNLNERRVENLKHTLTQFRSTMWDSETGTDAPANTHTRKFTQALQLPSVERFAIKEIKGQSSTQTRDSPSPLPTNQALLSQNKGCTID